MGAWVWWHQCSTNRRTELTKIRKYKHAWKREHFISTQQTRQHKCNREMFGAKCEKEKSFEIPIIPFYIKNNSLNRAKYWKITAMYFLRLKTWHKLMCWRVKEKRIAFFMAYAPRSTQMKRIKSVRALEVGMIWTIAFCVLLCERNTFSTVSAWCMDCWLVHWTSLGNDIQFDNDDEDDGSDGEMRDDGFFALHKTHLHSFVSLILILFIFSYSDLRCSSFAWLFIFSSSISSWLSLVYVSGAKRQSEFWVDSSKTGRPTATQIKSSLSLRSFWLRLQAQFHLYLSLWLFLFLIRKCHHLHSSE